MIQISSDQATPALRSLFDPNDPASLRCFAVLDGNVIGRILTDDPVQPTWSVVQEVGDGTSYLAGALDAPTIHQIVVELREEGNVLIGLWHDDERLALLPPDPDYDGETLEFTDRPLGEGLDSFLGQVPDGCEVRRMDRALFARCLWRDGVVRQYGSAAAFFAQGMGFCLMRGDEILNETYAGPSGLGMMEIGTTTHEPHRGQGCATITCAHAVQTCEESGYRTYWNCAKQNQASAAVARKLGYRTQKAYRLLAWFKPD